MAHQERITRDPAVCGGQPVIKGTRVLVRTILGYLAHGEATPTILAEFPSLTEDDVRAVIAFAAASAGEDLPPSVAHPARDQGRVRLKLDENIPVSVKPRLQALGFDVDTAMDEGLGGRPDGDIWAAAQAGGRFLITQDLDFSDTRRFVPGLHRGLLLVRLPDSEQWRIGEHLVAWFSGSDAASWERCFVVATPNKVRVLRPRDAP